MFAYPSYGPTSGSGISKIPYFGYKISDRENCWINVRTRFHKFQVIGFDLEMWYPNKKQGLNKYFPIKELELETKKEPNEKLKTFYDTLISYKQNQVEVDIIEEINQDKTDNLEDEIIYSELSKKLLYSHNLILRGAPGTGKTYLAKQIARELTDDNEEQIGFVQFHPSYDYTDFVEGLRPVKDDSGEIRFDIRPGIFKMFCKKAQENTDKKFVFIIDEINRGEISKIFGELFYSIDPGYRGEDGAVSTQYANMHQEEEKFYIPENVYIIGTMNDIDRSVDSFDFAMRRRFRFVEIKAADSMVMWEKDENFDNDQISEARTRLTNLNQAIENTPELNSNYHIGPSYFLKLPELDYDYEILWQDYLQPLLEEYLRGTFEEAERLRELKAAYDRLEEETHVDEG
jgi:5-methylcytosine-specific restriction protein B